MTKLPPDADRLLWEVAESKDPRAIDEFGQRFPHLRVELGKRLRMVENLKTARSSFNSHIPRFQSQRSTKKWVPVASAFAWGATLLALAAGSYIFTNQIIRRKDSSEHKMMIPKVNLNPPKSQSQVVFKGGTESQPRMNQKLPPNGSGTPSTGSNELPSAANSVSPNQLNTSHQDLISIRLHQVPLQTAIEAVGVSGHFSVQFAPGMPNPKVNMSYTNSDAREVLKDLGSTFDFTPIRQSAHFYLLIPARDRHDNSNANLNVNGGASISTP